jgi:hypothetical protein
MGDYRVRLCGAAHGTGLREPAARRAPRCESAPRSVCFCLRSHHQSGAPDASALRRAAFAALGIPLTEIHKQPRFSWRRWDVVNWQGVAASLPALPPEPAADPGGCPAGMLRVRGSVVVDASGRDDTDAVLAEQNATCTFWRTRTRGENGLCDRFDPDRWRARVAALPTKPMDFCIDRYEYPNAYGELPLVAVTFSEAEKYCKLEQKRLCSENEWTFACEGVTT